MSAAKEDSRPVLGPAGNKSAAAFRSATLTKKPAERPAEEKRRRAGPPRVSRGQEWLLMQSNLSLNGSCSSDISVDSFCSRATTGRIGRNVGPARRKSAVAGSEREAKAERRIPAVEFGDGKRRCGWVTASTDPCYASFHDEEWGVPIHDDKKLFELLVLSSSLAELTWPTLLSKRHIFREVFMDFDPLLVSKMKEKKIVAPGSIASSLLSEPKLRAIVENARQVLKIIEEFGSFDRYCWSFVNYKPIINKFRYCRQVPVKTPKAELISKDLMRRGFRTVGPTVVYSFMQSVGMTNDHVITCYRFEECNASAAETVIVSSDVKIDDKNGADIVRALDEMSMLS